MVSLDRFQSAIGSMQVGLTGDTSWIDVLWELDDLRQGSITNAPLDLGHRRLVSYDKAPGFVLGLRHSESLRRVLFFLPRVSSVTITLYGGTTIVCDPAVSVLALYQHAGEIVLRYDSEPYPTIGEVKVAYGFA